MGQLEQLVAEAKKRSQAREEQEHATQLRAEEAALLKRRNALNSIIQTWLPEFSSKVRVDIESRNNGEVYAAFKIDGKFFVLEESGNEGMYLLKHLSYAEKQVSIEIPKGERTPAKVQKFEDEFILKLDIF